MRSRHLVPLLLAVLMTGPVRADLLDDLGPAIRGGHVALGLALRPGAVPVTPAWKLRVKGSPLVAALLDASDGKVDGLRISAEGGELILEGKGLRPDIVLQTVEADGSGALTTARFHGKGLGRPLVAIFHGLALRAVKKLRFHTELAELLHGNLLVAGKETSAPAAAPPAAKSPSSGDFLELVDEVRVDGSHLTAFGERRLTFGTVLTFETASGSASPEPLRLEVDSLRYRPAHGGTPSTLRASGRIDGLLRRGEIAWGADRVAFATGRLTDGRFELGPGPDGGLATRVRAARLSLALTEGRFRAPGGIAVALAPGSKFDAKDLTWEPDGSLSALLDLDLKGKTGAFERQGSRFTLRDVAVRSHGLRVVRNRTSGAVDLDFDYQLVYPLVVKYPMPDVGERRVPLEFRGPFTSHLVLDDVGAGDEGRVEGDYRFKVPWAPVEKAAFEVLRARWSQDVPGLQKVTFELEPARFGPCGEACFVAKFRLSAEKVSGKRRLFRFDCVPEVSARLVVDKAARTFLLKGVKLRPQCEGLAGKVVDLIAPLLTKSYEDLVLFKLPSDLPVSIDEVKSGTDWIEASGRLAWDAGKPKAGGAK